MLEVHDLPVEDRFGSILHQDSLTQGRAEAGIHQGEVTAGGTAALLAGSEAPRLEERYPVRASDLQG